MYVLAGGMASTCVCDDARGFRLRLTPPLALQGWTPLHCAVSSGHEAAASFLLAAAAGAAQVDATTTSGRTPLHYAASKGKPALVKMLLSAGAAVGVRDETGSSPLHRGASAGKLEAVKVLVEEGRAQVDAVDGQGCSPLHVAAGCDHAHVALFLLSRGANPRLEAKDKTTPLDVASEALREALLREMPDGGARDDGMEA